MKTFIIILLLSILAAGCVGQQEKYQPKMEMTLSPSIATIESGKFSQPILITLKKLDSEQTPSEFTIVLESPNTEEIGFYDENKELIAMLPTQTFTYLNDQNTYAFLVKGKKLGSSEFTPYALKIELDYQGERIEKKQLSVKVT
ncbi:hypothetical protein HYU18_00130 [Candidatus Woesearchaeota archaeon]|nr:hypothetical protein [Candidatus Woesearchaeota archaeon]